MTTKEIRETLIRAITVQLTRTGTSPRNADLYAMLDELACNYYGAQVRDWYMGATDRQVTLLVNAASRTYERYH